MTASPDFLGQDLTRKALLAQSLEPFDAPVSMMQDDALDMVRRANAYRAITFGLSGIAIHGWEASIVEEAATARGYNFKQNDDDLFLPVGSLCDRSTNTWQAPILGVKALVEIENDLACAMQTYLDVGPGTHIEHGIDVTEVVNALWDCSLQAHNSGVANVAAAIARGRADRRVFSEQFSLFDVLSSGVFIWQYQPEHVIKALSTTARNITRFSVPIIDNIMAAIAGQRLEPGIPLMIPDEFMPSDIPELITNIFNDTIRASQRLDGVETRITEDFPELVVVCQDVSGKWIATWPRREKAPTSPVERFDFSSTADDFQAALGRQKCPIGYKMDGEFVMPGHRICRAIEQYMIDNRLMDPEVYTGPDIVYRPR